MWTFSHKFLYNTCKHYTLYHVICSYPCMVLLLLYISVIMIIKVIIEFTNTFSDSVYRCLSWFSWTSSVWQTLAKCAFQHSPCNIFLGNTCTFSLVTVGYRSRELCQLCWTNLVQVKIQHTFVSTPCDERSLQ